MNVHPTFLLLVRACKAAYNKKISAQILTICVLRQISMEHLPIKIMTELHFKEAFVWKIKVYKNI